MSKFGLKALRESVLRQKSHIMEPWSCISEEERSQTHPDNRVCGGVSFYLLVFFISFKILSCLHNRFNYSVHGFEPRKWKESQVC